MYNGVHGGSAVLNISVRATTELITNGDFSTWTTVLDDWFIWGLDQLDGGQIINWYQTP